GEHGIEVGYHCHAGDFEKVNGTAPWGVIGKNTKPEVIMQIDTANASQGGADPVAWIKEFPGRSKTVHLKDHGGETAVIGTGNVDFKAVIRASRQVGGAEWFIIEEESKDPAGALERVAQSLENLRKILKGM
ncbi:MAG: sugar phosphate isomerase/epimerase family protein, partial [Planctomycetota bacterium]